MNPRAKVARGSLWLYTGLLGLEAGAGVYETRVLVPLWSASPPETVRGWDPSITIASRQRFWSPLHPALVLAAGMALTSGWRAPREHRRWLLASTLASLAVEAATLTYYAPTLVGLLVEDGRVRGDAAITADAERWVRLNRVRAAVGTGALLAALRAVATAPPSD